MLASRRNVQAGFGQAGDSFRPDALRSPAELQALDPIQFPATIVQAARDGEIIAQGERAEYCYQIISGCVRTVRLLEDGRRQVGEFLFAGDAFGWETLHEHEFAAEAVSSVTLRRYRLSAIEERAARDPAVAFRLQQYSAAQMRAAREHLVLLGRKTAPERIASFLVQMEAKLGTGDCGVIELPMSRADMADYLGLTIETVCRGITELRRQGVLAVDRTRIAILDRRALMRAEAERLH